MKGSIIMVVLFLGRSVRIRVPPAMLTDSFTSKGGDPGVKIRLLTFFMSRVFTITEARKYTIQTE